MYSTESLCCTAEMGTTLQIIIFNTTIEKKTVNQRITL